MTHISGVCTHCAGPVTLSLPNGAWTHDGASCFTTDRPEARFLVPGEDTLKPKHIRGKR